MTCSCAFWPAGPYLRHRFVTELIFSSGTVDNGQWSRFHRFFSQAAWDLDKVAATLAKLLVRLLCPGARLLWAVDDTLCRKRGLQLFGVGMHHDPLISSKAKALTSWGHDWVVLCLVIVGPFWAPHKVFALPVAMRLYRNRQGVPKGKKRKTKTQQSQTKTPKDNHHRTRPELAVELLSLVSAWFPNQEHMVVGDKAYGGQSVLSHRPLKNIHLISGVHPKGALSAPAPPKVKGARGRPRKKGDCLPSLTQWADDPSKEWTKLEFDQFGLHTKLAVKTQTALYYKAGEDRLLTIVLTRDLVGDPKWSEQGVHVTSLRTLPYISRPVEAYANLRGSVRTCRGVCSKFGYSDRLVGPGPIGERRGMSIKLIVPKMMHAIGSSKYQ